MQERAHLVHGSFSVESKPGEGTRIFAAMPFVAEDESSPKDAPDKKAGQLSLERPAEEAVMVKHTDSPMSRGAQRIVPSSPP
jgi:hypothetical protein